MAAILLAACMTAANATAKQAVDLELVIGADISWSMSQAEAELQRQGIADAFRSREVMLAIQSGILQRIAVAYLEYASRGTGRVVIDWRIIGNMADANRFAEDLLQSGYIAGRYTSISDGLEIAAEMIERNDIEGTRRVIDISGDGPNNWGRPVDEVRDEIIARWITINGLPIINKADAFRTRFYLPDLDLYYQGCVIGGPGAFIIVANSIKDYARAIRRKLVLEIAGLVPVRHAATYRPVTRISSNDIRRKSPTGYVYPKGCDIGERMRILWYDDDL